MENNNDKSKERTIYQMVPFISIIVFYIITIIHNIVSFTILKSSSSNIGSKGSCISILVIFLRYSIYLVAFISAIICLVSKKEKNKKFTFISILLLGLWIPIAMLKIAPFSQTTKLLAKNNTTTNNSTSHKQDNEISTSNTNIKTTVKMVGEQEYEDKVKQCQITLAPNKLIKIGFGATLDDIKKAEGDNEIKTGHGLYKDKDSGRWYTGSQVSAYFIRIKEGDWNIDRQYDVDENGKVKSMGFDYYQDNNQIQGLYKKYLDLKQQFSEVYGEPVYIGQGEKTFLNNAPKNNDSNTFDEQMGNGKLMLASDFAAKNSKITLVVRGTKNNNPTLGSPNIGSIHM